MHMDAGVRAGEYVYRIVFRYRKFRQVSARGVDISVEGATIFIDL